MKVDFSVSPYIFLLIIPAIAITLILFFKTGKRFYTMKNRIASVIIHCIVLILCITALTGITFRWEKESVDSELVILVDQSYTSGYARSRADKFIKEVLEANDEEGCNVALVKFGYDQKIAVKMGNYTPDEAYEAYLSGETPDITATDIYSALSFVWDPVEGKSADGLITDPEKARILLVSDGLQTDREALNIVKLISLDGIRIDTAFFPTTFEPDARITGVTYPDKRLDVSEDFHIDFSIWSSFTGTVDFVVTDNGKKIWSSENNDVAIGAQTFGFDYEFTSAGHHELRFSLSSGDDNIRENNDYYSYYDIERYDNILIVEKYKGESQTLVDILNARSSSKEMFLTVVSTEDVPTEEQELFAYDEVILVNVAHEDLPDGFEEMLYNFVHEKGGGLLTVGGVEKNDKGEVVMTTNSKGEEVPKPHSYDVDDMRGTTLQKMLPVEASDFTPPVALAIVISRNLDVYAGGATDLDIALAVALESLNALTLHDLVSVTSIEVKPNQILDFTPMTERRTIENALDRFSNGDFGSSDFTPTIRQVCESLKAVPDVERRHILFISKGASNSSGSYFGEMEKFYRESNITLTEVNINTTDSSGLAHACHNESHFIDASSIRDIVKILKSEIGIEEMSGSLVEDFIPIANAQSGIFKGVDTGLLDKITMKGVLSTRAKSSETFVEPLRAQMVPLYAQWSYGAGKVGSFTSDLYGYWSNDFIKSDVGKKIIGNIMSELMPATLVSTPGLNLEFVEDNYHTQGNIYGFNGGPSNKLVAFVKQPGGGTVEKFDLSTFSLDGNRFEFENKTTGIYEITVAEVPASFDVFASNIRLATDIPEDKVFSSAHAYRVFSYSAEYDPSVDPFEVGRPLMIALSTRTDVEDSDKLITEAKELFGRVDVETRIFDPRPWLVATALVLFLLDIALRKFKFTFLKKLFHRGGSEPEQATPSE